MTLADWIRFKRLRRTQVAQLLGISPGHVTDLCNNRFWPTREMAQRIWHLTEGDVTPNDYLFENDSGLDLSDLGK